MILVLISRRLLGALITAPPLNENYEAIIILRTGLMLCTFKNQPQKKLTYLFCYLSRVGDFVMPRLEQRHIIRFLFSVGEIAIRILVVWIGTKIAARYFQEK